MQNTQTIQWNLIWIFVVIGAATGLVLGILRIRHKRSSKCPVSIHPLEQLLRRQRVCNELTSDFVADWADEQRKQFEKWQLVFLIGRVTEKTLPMFTTDRSMAQGMDAASYLFMAAINKEVKLPVAVQLINCTKMDETLAELLGDDEYRLLTND